MQAEKAAWRLAEGKIDLVTICPNFGEAPHGRANAICMQMFNLKIMPCLFQITQAIMLDNRCQLIFHKLLLPWLETGNDCLCSPGTYTLARSRQPQRRLHQGVSSSPPSSVCLPRACHLLGSHACKPGVVLYCVEQMGQVEEKETFGKVS